MKTLTTLLVFLFFTIISFGQNCLVADFPFDGNAQDVSGNSNHGTLMGSPSLTLGHNSAASSAYDFGANDGIDVNNTLGNFGTGDFSISTWVKYTSLPFSHARIFMKRNLCTAPAGSGPFYNLGVMNDGKVALETNDANYSSQISTGERIDDDEWHHLVLVRSGADHELYIDNTLNFTLVTSQVNNYINTAMLQFANDICVGIGSGVKYVGELDNIKFFNCAIGTSKIDSLFSLDFPVSVENKLKSNLKVYPNPTKGELIIEYENSNGVPNHVEIVNLFGEKVYRNDKVSFPLTIQLQQNLARGLYFLKIRDDKNRPLDSRKINLK